MWPVVNFDKERCDIYIGRPSRWSSPFMIGPSGSREEVLFQYEIWLQARPELIADICRELRGKILGCWCSPLQCHGDLLARIANGWQLALPLIIEEEE